MILDLLVVLFTAALLERSTKPALPPVFFIFLAGDVVDTFLDLREGEILFLDGELYLTSLDCTVEGSEIST